MPGGRLDELARAVSSGGTRQALQAVPAQLRDQVAAAAHEAFISGPNEILLVAAFVAFAGAVLGFALVRRRDFVARGPQAEAV